MHEASMHEANCFVTLTYGRDQLPVDGSLEHRDFQLFMKRLRFQLKTPIRFYMCGEYGPLNSRPHYHANLFGVDFRSDWVASGKSASGAVFYDSPTLSKLWGLGRVSVQPLTPETAGYCARYIMKKALGEGSSTAYVTVDGVVRRPEYAAMSLRPGIGFSWLQKYVSDVYPHDFVIADGSRFTPPKRYDAWVRRNAGVWFDEVEYERVKKALLVREHQTAERRAVREQVHTARVSTLKRDL